jgi:hypothetical protein
MLRLKVLFLVLALLLMGTRIQTIQAQLVDPAPIAIAKKFLQLIYPDAPLLALPFAVERGYCEAWQMLHPGVRERLDVIRWVVFGRIISGGQWRRISLSVGPVSRDGERYSVSFVITIRNEITGELRTRSGSLILLEDEGTLRVTLDEDTIRAVLAVDLSSVWVKPKCGK